MNQPRYRVIQWATGMVGTYALRDFIANPLFELAGVYVTNPDKMGKDAGDLAGVAPTGILATGNAAEILAMDADCVHFTPLVQDIPMVCALLRSGKNVVSPLGPYYRTERFRVDWEAIDAACEEGRTSFHGSGIHPGFAGDLLPLVASRLSSRIDRIHVYEVVDMLANPSPYIPFMGFGRDCADLLATPSRSSEAPHFFAQSMTMLADALGVTIDDLTTRFQVASATRDIAYPGGRIDAGTAAGQYYEWTAWSGARPFVTYHCFWTMGAGNSEPAWDCGESGYRVVIEGEPPLELKLSAPRGADGVIRYPGLQWTATAGVNAIPAVCNAPPGMVTHLDLGQFAPRGIVRPAMPTSA